MCVKGKIISRYLLRYMHTVVLCIVLMVLLLCPFLYAEPTQIYRFLHARRSFKVSILSHLPNWSAYFNIGEDTTVCCTLGCSLMGVYIKV